MSLMAGRVGVVLATIVAAGALGAPAAFAGASYQIYRIAGTGVAGVPVPGAATNSPLSAPNAVAVGNAGTVYTVDANHKVEQVTDTNRLSIVGGDGQLGAPVPGPAVHSPLGDLRGIAVDSSGNLYLADASNNVVERITPGGTLSIVAGGGSTVPSTTPVTATSAQLSAPAGVGVDSSDNLYIADSGDNTVEEVTGGVLTTIAGDGTQGAPTGGVATASDLNGPDAVVVDSSGDVYIADAGNYEVEEVVSGTLSIVAGDGSEGPPSIPNPPLSSPLGAPRGLAFYNGALDIADAENSRVEAASIGFHINPLAGNGFAGAPVYGGSAAATMQNQPEGVAAAYGTWYIADTGNNTVDAVVEADHATPSNSGVGDVAPSISGGGVQGLTLTADPGIWSDADAYSYQWQRCDADGNGCVVITGATSWTYTMTDADIGDTLQVIVTGIDAGGSTPAASGLTGVIAPAPPANITLPVITGTPAGGQVLTASNGTWTNSPTSYAYQWQDCNSSGANCTTIVGATSNSYTVGAGDTGGTIEVVVTATGAGGSASSASTPTSQVPSIPSPTPAPPGPVAAVPSPTPAPPGPAPVTVGTVPPAGIAVSDQGVAMISLVCPSTPTGCDASGVLIIHLPLPRTLVAHNSTTDSTVLASFSGQKIASGHSALIAVHLRRAVLRRLQTLKIRRVRVTLTISNHLSGGPGITSTQTVWLRIPPLPTDACPVPTGQLDTTRIGPITLGLSRAHARRIMPDYAVRNYHTDDFCLYGGAGIRVGYASARLLGTPVGAAQATTTGEIVLALTANPFYTLVGVRPGTTLATAARHLHLGTAIHCGRNDWYIIPGASSNEVLKVRHGIIREMGIANKALTTTRPAQARLLGHF